MRPNESGITRASMSHTIGSLNELTDSIMCDTIRKRSKACSISFFELDVELFMRGYIAWYFAYYHGSRTHLGLR
jgi:hypothetical protein